MIVVEQVLVGQAVVLDVACADDGIGVVGECLGYSLATLVLEQQLKDTENGRSQGCVIILKRKIGHLIHHSLKILPIQPLELLLIQIIQIHILVMNLYGKSFLLPSILYGDVIGATHL